MSALLTIWAIGLVLTFVFCVWVNRDGHVRPGGFFQIIALSMFWPFLVLAVVGLMVIEAVKP